MKKTIIILVALTMAFNSLMAQQQSETEVNIAETAFITRNIAFFDARVRSLNSSTYVKEIYLVNFSSERWDKTELVYDGKKYMDNGAGTDLTSGDGIFTSIDEFQHGAAVPYDSKALTRSVLEQPIVDHDFQYKEPLKTMRANYLKTMPSTTVSNGGTATLDCDIEWICGCWGSCCWFKITNCHFTVGW